MSTTYGPRTPALTPARATRLAKAAAPELRWSSEKGVRGILVRVWDAPDDGTDRTELRVLNEARRLINATDLSASVVSVRSRKGRPQFRILVTDEAQEAAEMQEREDARRAALAAAAEEVKAAQTAAEEEPVRRGPSTSRATAPAPLCTTAYSTPGYPPYTTAEALEAAAEGLSLHAPNGGAFRHEVRRGDHHGAVLGHVQCMTDEEDLRTVRFGAYRPDGSRAGIANTRVGAASLLLHPERANTFWIEQENAARAALTPAVVTFTNPELWGAPAVSAEDAAINALEAADALDEQVYADRLGC